MKKEVISFLEMVWMQQPRGTYGVIAWKEGELWRQRFPRRDEIEAAYRHRGRDLYFCPNLFVKPRRKNECAAPSRWLYADLDESDPRELEIPPTVWWETSPGRYQSLWQLDCTLGLDAHARLNQKLTYFCNADRNGWPLSKVLRIPGTVSTKWDKPFRIEVGDQLDVVYSPKEIWRIVQHVEVPVMDLAEISVEEWSNAREVVGSLSTQARSMWRRRRARDRSAHVWQLACLVRDEGLTQEDAAAVLMTSPVAQDKYGSRLQNQVQMVIAKAWAQKPKQARATRVNGHQSFFHVDGADRFLARELRPPGWMVGDIWSDDAHGLMVGEHKSFKSLIAMDLAFSVATGTKFLNHFDVPKTGHVLYVQEENKPQQVRDRLEKLTHSRGLQGMVRMRGNSIEMRRAAQIPMDFINNESVDLTSEDHLQELARIIKDRKSKLLVLDPLYLMIPGVEENSASSMTPVLHNLLKIKQQLGVGILITHHYKKQDRDSPMIADDSRIAGTSAFGRWYESLLLVERPDHTKTEVKLYPKHRLAAPMPGGITVEFDMDDMGGLYYQPRVIVAKEELKDLYNKIKDVVRARPGISISELAKDFEMRTETMRRRVEKSSSFRIVQVAGSSPEVYLRGR